jgi:formylglycine-generating enzyme required for sulfatase activity
MRKPARFVVGISLAAGLFGCDLVSPPGGPHPKDFGTQSSPTDTNDTTSGGPAPTATTDSAPVSPPPAATTAPPSPTDGIANGDETDVDCGGSSAPKCDTGKSCKTAGDCTTNVCGDSGNCQIAPSCTGKIGADNHCGPSFDESCCSSADVPTTDYSVAKWNLTAHVSEYRLDKYEITVGRMRAFFDAMQGSPQTNFEPKVLAAKPSAGANPHVAGSGWSPSWTKRLPASWTDIASRYGDPAEAPDGTQFCMRGANGDYGTSTYKSTADDNVSIADNFEMKPIVCIDWYTLYAFCAWDGGRLPTSIEWGAAAGDDQGYTYSWGFDPPSETNVVTALKGFVGDYPDFTWGAPVRFAGDRGTHVAPGGQKQAGHLGHFDLSGNVAEWLLDSYVPTGTCTDCAEISGWKDPTLAWPSPEPTLGAGSPTWNDGGVRVARGGTWEGHDVHNVDGTWNGVGVGFTYHALGGRCARDVVSP